MSKLRFAVLKFIFSNNKEMLGEQIVLEMDGDKVLELIRSDVAGRLIRLGNQNGYSLSEVDEALVAGWNTAVNNICSQTVKVI